MDKSIKNKKEQKLKTMLKNMPIFVNDYFRRIRSSSINTRIQYCYDINLFLTYLIENESEFKGLQVSKLTYDHLNTIDLNHIDRYFEYISIYKTKVPLKNSVKGKVIVRENNEYGTNRKAASLRSMFSNLYKISLSKDENDKNRLIKNIGSLIPLHSPKVKEKYRMNYDIMAGFIEAMIQGKGEEGEFNKKKQNYIKNNTLDRDLCIIALFMETGMRVSELVGINIEDIDFDDRKIKITRKGGKEEFVYYTDFSEYYIRKYYEIRKSIIALPEHESAFFLSLQRKRPTVRSIELMIDKYAEIFTNKKITPHTFRRSFATMMYEQTRDAYLVASLIGDTVAVTTKHYAKQKEEFKREAINNFLPKKIGENKS